MVFNQKIKYDYQGSFNPQKLAADNIDHLSTAFISPDSKILELGCSTGFMSQYFSSKLNCQVTGVDINPQALKKAKKHCQQVILGDLEDKSIQKIIKLSGPFDIVFASAVIEHLKNPESVLQLIKQVLKPKGILIITTSNIAHWRIRLKLFLGNWNYQDYGVLDKTHLKFYTYHTFQTLIKSAGFKILKVKIDPAGGIKFLNLIFKNFPNLYAHQIVIKAQKA